MDAIFIDIETTGDDPTRFQMYEFAAVPVIGGVIRRDLMWHTYIDHRTWKIQAEIFKMVTDRLANPRADVPHIKPYEWSRIFKNKVKEWQDLPATFGGKNFASFDFQFMLNLDGDLRDLKGELFRYSHIEIGSMLIEKGDHKILSLADCRTRAIEEGAPISVENTHFADADALLCAELYCWEVFGNILYGKQHPDREDTVKIYTAGAA